MTPKQQRALFIRNAKACESAKHPKCTCVCGGVHHGKSHAAVMEELWEAFREQHPEPQSPQPELQP